MSGWIARGLRRGILTTRYPDGLFEMPERYRGRLRVRQDASRDDCARGAEACLSRAIVLGEEASHVRMERCFQCGECRRRAPDAFDLTNDYEVACVDDDVAVNPGHVISLIRREAGRIPGGPSRTFRPRGGVCAQAS